MPQFGSAKWFWPSIFAQDAAEAGKRHIKTQQLPVVDWLDYLIGTSGLLLVSLLAFAIPVSAIKWVRSKKSK
jgi:hypothetical protein